MPASCTDGAEYRTDCTRRAGIIGTAVPRTVPRPRRPRPLILLLCVTSPRATGLRLPTARPQRAAHLSRRSPWAGQRYTPSRPGHRSVPHRRDCRRHRSRSRPGRRMYRRHGMRGRPRLTHARTARRSCALGHRITRGTRRGCTCAGCTDSTGHRTDATRGAGIIRRPGPRTGPRPRPCFPRILLLCVNVADAHGSGPASGQGAGAAGDQYASRYAVRLVDREGPHGSADERELRDRIFLRCPVCR